MPVKGMGVQVPPRTPRDHLLTCGNTPRAQVGAHPKRESAQVSSHGGSSRPRTLLRACDCRADHGRADDPASLSPRLPARPRPAAHQDAAMRPVRSQTAVDSARHLLLGRRRTPNRNSYFIYRYSAWLPFRTSHSACRHLRLAGHRGEQTLACSRRRPGPELRLRVNREKRRRVAVNGRGTAGRRPARRRRPCRAGPGS